MKSSVSIASCSIKAFCDGVRCFATGLVLLRAAGVVVAIALVLLGISEPCDGRSGGVPGITAMAGLPNNP